MQIPQGEGAVLGVVCPIEKHDESLFIAPSPHPWWTDFNDLWQFLCKKVPFWGRIDTASHIGVKYSHNPEFGGVNTHFKQWIDRSAWNLECWRILDLGAVWAVDILNFKKFNSRWQTASVLRNREKAIIYLQQFDQSAWNLAWWGILILEPCSHLKFWIKKNLRWQMGTILKNRKMAITTMKYGTVTYTDSKNHISS